MKNVFKILVIAFILLLFSLGHQHTKNAFINNRTLLPGEHLPDFVVHNSYKKISIFRQYSQKLFLPVIDLNCSSCRILLAKISTLVNELKKFNVKTIVLAKNDYDKVCAFKREPQNNLNIVSIDSLTVSKKLRIFRFPALILVDEFMRIIRVIPAAACKNLSLQKLKNHFNYSIEDKRKKMARHLGGKFLGSSDVLFQKKHNSCGNACLKMILNDFALPLENTNCSLNDLKRSAETLGMHAQGWHLQYADLLKISQPVIARINRSHFVVIAKSDQENVWVKDPLIGRVVFTKNSFNKIWHGKILLIKANKI